MKFTTKVVIAQPRQRVLELIMDPYRLSQWQPGIKSVDLLTGHKDRPGARSRVVFELRGIRLEAIETVVKRQPPEVFSATYEARGVKNLVENRFYEEGAGQTRWVMHNTFEFSRLMSVGAIFVQDLIAKHTLEAMNWFKAFAESIDDLSVMTSDGSAAK